MLPQDNDFRATLREAKALVHSPESLPSETVDDSCQEDRTVALLQLDQLIQREGDPDLWHSWAFDPPVFVGDHEYLLDPTDKRPRGPLDHWDAKRMLTLHATEANWQALEQGILDYCGVAVTRRYVSVDAPEDHPHEEAISPDLLTVDQTLAWPTKREWVRNRKRDLALPTWALVMLSARTGEGDIRQLRIESRSWLPQLLTFLSIQCLVLVEERHIRAYVLAELVLRSQVKDGPLPSAFSDAIDSSLSWYERYRAHALSNTFNDFPTTGTS
jgi:hypothetical protein